MKVDKALSSQILEKIFAPQVYLKGANGFLKYSGPLLLSTYGYWWCYPFPQLAGDGLKKVLHEAGFKFDLFHGLIGFAREVGELFYDAAFQRMRRLSHPLCGFFGQAAIALDCLPTSSSHEKDVMVYVKTAEKVRDSL